MENVGELGAVEKDEEKVTRKREGFRVDQG